MKNTLVGVDLAKTVFEIAEYFGAVTGLLSLYKEMPSLPMADLTGSYEAAFALTAAMADARTLWEQAPPPSC